MGDWITVLHAECDRSSQAAVARRLGVSGALVNQVLKGTYKGNLTRIEELVRGTFMQEMVDCPVMGPTSKRRCMDEQSRPFAPTNPQRVHLFKTCKQCAKRGGKHGTDF